MERDLAPWTSIGIRGVAQPPINEGFQQTGKHVHYDQEDATGSHQCLSVGLGHTLDLVLLLDGVAVGGALGGVDDLISQTLRHRLDVAERSLASLSLILSRRAYTLGDQAQSEAHTAEGRHIHSLATHHTGSADTGGVFAGTRVRHGLHQHLDGVLVGHQVDDVESLLDDLHRVHLLTGVAAVEHEAVREALHKRALGITQNRNRPPGPCGIS